MNNPLIYRDPLGLSCVFYVEGGPTDGDVDPFIDDEITCAEWGGVWYDDTPGVVVNGGGGGGVDPNWNPGGSCVPVTAGGFSGTSCGFPVGGISLGGGGDVGGGGGGGGGGSDGGGSTPGLRAPGQTFNECMQANAGNYSLLGAADFALGASGAIADNFWLGFTPASNTLATIYNAAAGSLDSVFQMGPQVATTAAGSVITSGRRTSTIISMNIPGTRGGPKGGFPALGPNPSNAKLAAQAAMALLKFAVDAGFFLAEAAGCTGPAN